MSRCVCNTIESVRLTNEHMQHNGVLGFRPRCGVCAGKLPSWAMPAHLVSQLPNPEAVPMVIRERILDEYLDYDGDAEDVSVTVTVSIESPVVGDTEDSVDIVLENYDNPFDAMNHFNNPEPQ